MVLFAFLKIELNCSLDLLQEDESPETKSDKSSTAEDASAPHRCDAESESGQVLISYTTAQNYFFM